MRAASLLLIWLAGCKHPSGEGAQTPPAAEQPSIGSVTMEADGTLVLQLRATDGTSMGDALLRYPPDHPHYKEILDHVSPIRPGETKPVAPFD